MRTIFGYQTTYLWREEGMKRGDVVLGGAGFELTIYSQCTYIVTWFVLHSMFVYKLVPTPFCTFYWRGGGLCRFWAETSSKQTPDLVSKSQIWHSPGQEMKASRPRSAELASWELVLEGEPLVQDSVPAVQLFVALRALLQVLSSQIHVKNYSY